MKSTSSRKSSGNPSRSTLNPSGSLTDQEPSRNDEKEPDSETEPASTASEGIPPESIACIRSNLRGIIEKMGDTSDQNQVTSESSDCRCCRCGKSTSSESSDCCTCPPQRGYPEPAYGNFPCGPVVQMPPMPMIYNYPPLYYPAPQNSGLPCPVQQNPGLPYPVDPELCPCDGPCPGKADARTRLKNLFDRVAHRNNNAIRSQHELYKFHLKNNENYRPPKQLVFDLVEGIPTLNCGDRQQKVVGVAVGGDCKDGCKVEKHRPKPKIAPDLCNKVDIYYFDHGNSGYYRTTDHPPPLMADFFIEQTDLYATRFWAEIFGTLHIGVAFITSFLLQLLRFLLYSIIRPLTVGAIQLTSDYFFKPFLSMLFNGVLQPVLILFYNVATSFRDLCEPIAHGIGYFMREVAGVIRALRLIEVNKVKTTNKGGHNEEMI